MSPDAKRPLLPALWLRAMLLMVAGLVLSLPFVSAAAAKGKGGAGKTAAAGEGAPKTKGGQVMPPEGWTWPVTKLAVYHPTAADVLTPPANLGEGYTLAKTPPANIYFAVLPGQWPGTKLWSNWGDGVAPADGNLYCSIGNHAGPHGCAYVYKVDPKAGTVQMVVDVTKETGVTDVSKYTPGKIHGPLVDGGDGWIYFGGYRGDGAFTTVELGGAGDPFLRYELATGKVENLGVIIPDASLPTYKIYKPLSLLVGLSQPAASAGGKPSDLYVYDLKNKKMVFRGGPVPNMRRAVALAGNGCVYYSHRAGAAGGGDEEGAGEDAAPQDRAAKRQKKKEPPTTPAFLAKYDPKTNTAVVTKAVVPGDGSLRAATVCDSKGVIYCVDHKGLIYSLDTNTDTIQVLGNAVNPGQSGYCAVAKLDPTEKYVYLVPGSHGGSSSVGSAVIQFNVQTKQRKVIAFLNSYLRKTDNYNCGGTFGTALSPDGSKLLMCWNGKSLEGQSGGKIEFGDCSVVVIDIPESERQ